MRGEIPRHIWGVIDRAARASSGAKRRSGCTIRRRRKKAIAELQRRYDAFRRAHDARRRSVGLTARAGAAEEAEDAATDALEALIKAKPATAEGIKALARHLAALSPAQAPWWAMRAVLETVSAA